ncbi:hypothetical protein VTO42DRAFT_1875 [Malbranchea cinnamomea]
MNLRPSPALHRLMSQVRNLDGVFAVHKPADITSYDVIRDLQKHFKASKFFQPWLEAERKRLSELPQQGRRHKHKKVDIKLGHGGTLDPIATGVLITGVGKGTKELGGFLGCTKTYEAVVLFGVATDSYDRVGKVVKRAPYDHVTREAVEKALEQFRGRIMQKPSIFSALKVQGKKLYEYAREGKEPPVEIAKRPVEVFDLRILEWYEGGTHDYSWPEEEAGENEKRIANKMFGNTEERDTATPCATDDHQASKRKSPPPADAGTSVTEAESLEPPAKRPKTGLESEATPQPPASAGMSTELAPDAPSGKTGSRGPPAVKLTMTVSSGFYVRSLAHDLGVALGSNAIMSSLVRTRQGDFDISPENIIEYKDLEAGEDVWGPKLQRFLDRWASRKAEGKEGEKEPQSDGKRDEEFEL